MLKKMSEYGKVIMVVVGAFVMITAVESTYIQQRMDSNRISVDNHYETISDKTNQRLVPTEKSAVKPVQKSAEKTTVNVTQKSAEKTTVNVTQKSTEKPTVNAIQKSTEKSTVKVSQKSAEKPTVNATQKSTEKTTAKTTQKSTEKTTVNVTQKSTEKPTVNTTDKSPKKSVKIPKQVPTEPPTTPDNQATVSDKGHTIEENSNSGFVITTDPPTEWSQELQDKYNEQYDRGYLIAIDNPDYSYATGQVVLCEEDKKLACQIVMGEAGGEDFEDCCVVAQCLKDSMVFLGYNSIKEVQKECRYDGFREEYSAKAQAAVEYIFDQNRSAVAHRVLFFYAADLCQSEWHESQYHVLTRRYARYFDMW